MSTMTWEQSVQWLREQPGQEALVRACYFDDPLPEAAERFRESAEWRAIAALLPPPPGAALDLGAGRGISSYALARDGWDVTALEPDPSELVGAGAIRALSRQSGVPIRVVGEYAESLPFPDGSFDVVNCRQALHHARDLWQTCREIRRVLKPGGHFYHSDLLRPRNPIVKNLYYTYLRGCLGITGLIVGSGQAAVKAKQYFLDALELFYTAEDLSILLRELGYVEVKMDTVFHGMIGFHRAVKPLPAAQA